MYKLQGYMYCQAIALTYTWGIMLMAICRRVTMVDRILGLCMPAGLPYCSACSRPIRLP